MSKKYSRLLGLVLVLGALIALWFFLPGLFHVRMSNSGFALISIDRIRQIALDYLVAGLAAGFGLALLLWPYKDK
jgi:hypothetical protein